MGSVSLCNHEFVCSNRIAIVGSLGLLGFFACEKIGPCRVCTSYKNANGSRVGDGQVQRFRNDVTANPPFPHA